MTTTETSTEATEATESETTDWQAEAKKWKDLADTTEKRAKRFAEESKTNAQAAKDLETLRQSTMSDTEKAVAQARAEARIEALRESGTRLAAAEIRVAAAGRHPDLDALIEGVDAARFVDADGNPDTKAIKSWVDRAIPAGDDKASSKRDLGLGARGQQAPALNSDPLLGALKSKLGIP